MRYERISPDSEAVSNGRRMGSNLNWKTYKEDEEEEDRVMKDIMNSCKGSLESKGSREGGGGGGNLSRFRSPNDKNGIDSDGDVLLQWGNRKRSRCSRGIIAVAVSPTTYDSSSSSSAAQLLLPNKLQRRSSAPQPSSSNINNSNNNNNNTNGTTHPPSLPSSSIIVPKAPNIKSSSRIASSTASHVRRGSEGRSGGAIAGEAKFSPSQNGGASNMIVPSRSRAAGAFKKITPSSGGQPLLTTSRGDSINASPLKQNHPEPISIASTSINGIPTKKLVGGEKMNSVVEVHEWPRIYIALSKKEKEEDFMAMKGSKLPHRPKKRPKAIDKMLQYCYPGMWLSDLTRGRYEVREKKSTKKQKRRGLKGMDNIESESE